jgi:hypothetical protein
VGIVFAVVVMDWWCNDKAAADGLSKLCDAVLCGIDLRCPPKQSEENLSNTAQAKSIDALKIKL